jgi:hypothetical protein
MDRRDFIKKIGGTAAVLTVVPGAVIASSVSTGMAAPLPASKVMALVERETISSVERSVIQSQRIMIIKTRQLGMTNFHAAMQAHLDNYKSSVMKTQVAINKMQVYEPKDFF